MDGISSVKVTHWDSAYDWYALMTTDEETADGIINKWNEVVSFLANIAQTDTLSGIVDGINKSISDEVTRAKKAEGVNASGISTNKTGITTLQGYFTSGSAKKALQLTNARKLWGNSFNGTADINGSIIVPNGKYISIGNIKMEYDATNKAIKIDGNLYATGGITAYGAASSGAGGGGLNASVISYARIIEGSYTDADLTSIPNAYAIKALDSRIVSLEGGSAMDVSVSGSGNAVTAISKSGTTISVTKGITFLTSHQSLDGYVNEVATSGTGNAITSVSKSGKKLTFTKGATFLTSHQSLANYYTKGKTDSLLSDKQDASGSLTFFSSGGKYVGSRFFGDDNLNKLASQQYIELWSNYGFFNLNVGNINASKVIIKNGTSNQFIKADGSLDSNSYLTSHQSLANYVTINSKQTISGIKTFNEAIYSTCHSDTWYNGVNEAALTVNYTDYGAIFCAPVKNGRISLSTYPGANDVLYFGYIPKSQDSSNNSLYNKMSWDASENKLYVATVNANTFLGSIAWSYIINKPTTISGYGITDGVSSVSVTGSGNAVTSVSKSGTSVTFTKGATFLTSHQSLANYYTKGKTDSLLSDKQDASGSLTFFSSGGKYVGSRFFGDDNLNKLASQQYIELWSNYGFFNLNVGNIDVIGNVLATGGITAYSSSDIRLKTDLRKLDFLGIIKAMGGTFSFAWKKDNTRSIGWIAQHVLCNPHLKDIVETDEKGYYKINYWSPKLIATAFGAIEQVGDEVSRLKARVVFLESEVQRLSGKQDSSDKKRLGNKNIKSLN